MNINFLPMKAGHTLLEQDKLPDELVKNIISLYGDQGKQWLADLPQFLLSCEQQWNLKLMPCYRNLNFNYVTPAILVDHTPVVLKCSPVVNHEFSTEIAALEHFDGIGAVTLLKSDLASGKVLLECITPGNSLEALNHTQEVVNISIAVMNQLHKPLISSNEVQSMASSAPTFSFPSLHQWFQGFKKLRQTFHDGTGPFPAHLIDYAEQVSKELLASMGEQVLLHGDLHYGNIIFSEDRGWLAIDPKGVIGEREFEIPLPKLNEAFTKQQLESTLKFFIEATGYDKERVLGWLFTKAVLAAWWTFEDQEEVGAPFIACAELVQTIKF